MKRELGDVLCIGFRDAKHWNTPDEVMDENIRKLEKRYPNGLKVEVSARTGDIMANHVYFNVKSMV